MANIFPNVKPTGLTLKDLVDWFYMAFYSLQGLCQKLDADGGVPLTTYEANVVTALCNLVVEYDSLGNVLNLAADNTSSLPPTVIIKSNAMDAAAIPELIFQLINALETLTEQLDADTLGDSNYEALCYTATMPWMAEDRFGAIVGNDNVFYFRPTGSYPRAEIIDFMYDWMNSWETLCEKLDADGTVTDTTYEALWYTATYLIRVENSKGSALGVSR
jgi:hypothetical protein